MVYDDRGNFVGDTHWREEYNFEEGEELDLERSGIMIQVSECVGKRDQDLTELLDKRVKDREERVNARTAASSPLNTPRPALRTKIYNTPPAAPSQERLAKRRKPNDSPPSRNGYAQSLTGATLTLSGRPPSSVPLRYDPSWIRKLNQPIESIDLSEYTGLSPAPGRRTVPDNSRSGPAHAGGNKIEKRLERSSPERGGSGYARDITGASLILSSTAPKNRLLPFGARPQEKDSSVNREKPLAVQHEPEDEFLDIEAVLDVPSPGEHPSKHRLEDRHHTAPNGKCPPRPQDAPTRESIVQEDQMKKTMNPLRIKARPKRSLLLLARPQARPSLSTDPSLPQKAGANDGLIFHTGIGDTSLRPSVNRPVINRERHEQRAKAHSKKAEQSLNELNVSSSPEGVGIDHNAIDVLLTRKTSVQTSKIGIQTFKTQAPGHEEGSVQPTEALKETRPTGELGVVVAKELSPVSPARSQLREEPEDTAQQLPVSIMESDTPGNVKNEIETASEEETRREVSRLSMPALEDSSITTAPYRPRDETLPQKDAGPFKRPAMLINPATRGKKAAQRSDAAGKVAEAVLPPVISIIERPQFAKPATTSRQAIAGTNDQGPWSREAFDLFDWRPG
jgi:hypothetical protein